ncbi:hypothetical protein ACFL2R_03100 [Patescibacteria group bacterium]
MKQQESIPERFIGNSCDYAEILGLTEKEMEEMEDDFNGTAGADDKMILHNLEIEGKSFELELLNVYMVDYSCESTWRVCIVVNCLSHPTLNQSMGRGTKWLNVVSIEWHEKIMQCLRDKKNM